MSKNVLKEVIIVLLLSIAIILLLAILLYDYVPSKKVLPETVSYTTPQEVTQALIQSGGVDDSQIILTYELDAADLNNYERINDYNPGKANPFSSYETTGANTTTSGSQGGATSGENTTTGGSNTTNNKTEVNTTNENSQYSKDTGTK